MCVLHQVLHAWQRLLGQRQLGQRLLGQRQLGQRLRYGHGCVQGAGLLGQLQDGHVAQRAHLSHLQPLDEAPGGREGDNETQTNGETVKRDRWDRGDTGERFFVDVVCIFMLY